MLGPCFNLQYFMCILILHLSRWGRESWLIYFCCVLVSCRCYRSLTLPHGVMGWSVICDCGISGRNHLLKDRLYLVPIYVMISQLLKRREKHTKPTIAGI